MRTVTSILLLMMGLAGALMAVNSAPEVNPGSAVSAVALLSGTLLVIRGRRRR